MRDSNSRSTIYVTDLRAISSYEVILIFECGLNVLHDMVGVELVGWDAWTL